MKKLAVLVLMFAFMSPAFAEDVVSEAQKQIAKEKHEARVLQAKRVLQRKEELQKKIEQTQKDLLQADADLQNAIACDDKDQGWKNTDCKEEKASFSGATGIVSSGTTLSTIDLSTNGNYWVSQ